MNAPPLTSSGHALTPPLVAVRLAALQTELVDLAFELERRGRIEAADVAIVFARKIAGLREETLGVTPSNSCRHELETNLSAGPALNR